MSWHSLEPPSIITYHGDQKRRTLVCDLMELYRYLIDDFVIQYCKSLKKKDFAMKNEDYSSNRKGEREYLNKALAKDTETGRLWKL